MQDQTIFTECWRKLVSFSVWKMKYNERVKVLLKAIQKIYHKNPIIQEVIDTSMKEVRTEECISPGQEFAVVFIIMAILEENHE